MEILSKPTPGLVSRYETRDMSARRIACEVGTPLVDQPSIGHNRWHPDIPPALEVEHGDEIIVETPGYDDYQLHDDDGVGDVETMDLSRVHPLVGPLFVAGAEPGDLLVVELLDIGPLSGIGYSCIIPEIGGILKDVFPKAFKSVWHMPGDVYAESRHVPGVRLPALPHPGVIGVAPSHEMLELWNKREARLVEEGKAYGPDGETAVLRGLPDATVGEEAARTVPPRENGGNVDIKNLSSGSRLYFPVFVPGALLSIGDVHFCEGDGEATWNAIEMDGETWIRVGVLKSAARRYDIRTPIFEPGPLEPNFGNRYLTFTGFCFRGEQQEYVDCTMAAREAMLQAIDYLTKFGYDGYQAYTLLSVAPIELRICGTVDVPNACVSLAIPYDIFDDDVLPKPAP